MKIAVVGCGTAGAAATLFLARDGHDVTLFEQVEDPRPVGAGLLIQPTGLAVLRELGLADAILAGSARVARLRGTTPKGRVLMDLAYADLAPELFGVGVHRGTLFTTLFDAVRASSATIELGRRVERRDELAAFDLTVVADGARSALRPASARVRPYAWSALWFIGADPDGRYEGALSQVYAGTTRLVGFLPTGGGRVSFFWGLRDVDAWRGRSIDAWKDEVRAITDRADPILDQIASHDDLIHAVYHDVRMAAWHAPGVVYLGDAAHAMTPHLGQGANLALLDARALAACVPDLAAYERRRRAHVGYYQWASRVLMPLFQSGHRYLGPLRDLFIPLGLKVGWLRTQALRTMAGAKTGLFRAAPELLE